MTERVSTDAAGAQLTGPSDTPAVSADGRYVAFVTTVALSVNDLNGVGDVYRKDTWSGAVDLVSASTSGAAGNAASTGEAVALSDDGTKVVFRSDATDLVASDGNVQTDLFRRDMATGITERVNVSSDGSTTALGPDFFSVSADGAKVAFVSYTSLDGRPADAVYVRDVGAGTTSFIHEAEGAPIAISGDGTKVAFEWSAPGTRELYLHDANDPVLYRINFGTSANFADVAGILGPDAMSHDGNVVAFLSDGDTYDNDPATVEPRGVYVYDHVAKDVSRVSETATGANANQGSGGTTNDWPKGAVSADGSLVAFTSQASNLDPNAPSGGAMVKNRITGEVAARSVGVDGSAKPVSNTTLSSNGQVVAFASAVPDVVPGDSNGASDVFTNADNGIVGINLSLTHDVASAVRASPAVVPFTDIPVDPLSPRTQSSGIGLIDVLSSPIGLIDVSSSGIGLIDVLSSPIGLIDVSSSGIGLIDVLSSPALRDSLDGIMLSQLPLRDPLTWEKVLGYPVQTQSTSLLDALSLDPRPAGLATLAVPGALDDPASTPLAQLSAYSLLLGSTPLANFSLETGTPTWCERLEALGYPSCGAELDDVDSQPRQATNRSLLELQLAGVPFDGDGDGDRALPVHLAKVGELQLSSGTPLLGVKLAHLQGIQPGFANLAGSQLGAVQVGSLPDVDAVVDCSAPNFDCTTANLAEAAAAGALQQAATFGDLGSAADPLLLAQVIHALLPATDNAFANATAEQLGIHDYSGPRTSIVNYTLRFQADRPLTNGRFEVTIPEDSLLVRLGSATLSINGAEPTPVAASATGHTVTFPMGQGVAAGDEVLIRFQVRPGLRTGTFSLTATAVGDDLLHTVTDAAPLQVIPNQVSFESGAGTETVLPGHLYAQHVSGAGRQLKQVWLEAGDRLDVTVSDLSVDLDAVLYHPVGSPTAPLRQPKVERDPIVPVADEPASLSSTGEPLSGEIRDDIAFEDLPVAAVSANRGTASERLQALATATGWHQIQVAPYLQAETDEHFLMSVSVIGATPLPACSPRTFAHDADPYTGTDEAATVAGRLIDGPEATPLDELPAETKTVFLVNQDRISDRFGAPAAADTIAALRALRDDAGTETDPGTKSLVEAAIVSVDADAGVRAAYQHWDTAAGVCDPEAANDVVRAINAAVDSVVGSASIEHLVLVGDDEMLPFARVVDLTIDDNERGYAGDLAALGNNALRSAYGNGYLPTDDPYGDFDPQPYAGRYLYVSDVALGRLVEKPADWIGALNRFVAFDGQLEPATALTTGYEFMADSGAEIDATVEAQLGGQQPDLLSETWTKSDLTTAFTSRTDAAGNPLPAPDLVTLNGHFDHRRALPAAGPALFETAEVDNGADLLGRLVHTMGCHSGVSVADVLIGAAPTNANLVRDWAQSFSERDAAGYVGQTGYGLGLNALVALSERILADYARNLSTSPTTGAALAEAKQAYAAQLGVFGVYDEKALAEATYFGLPMYRVAGVTPVPKPAPQGTGTTGFDPSAAYIAGLQSASLVVDNPVVSEVLIGDRTALTIDGEALVIEDRPIMPKITVATPPHTTGLLLTELASVDSAPTYRPAFADAVSDLGSRSRARTSGDVVFPAAPHALSATRAVIIPAQFRVTDPATGTGIRRDFTHMKYRALQPADPATCTDRIRPQIHSATGTVVVDPLAGNQAALTVEVGDASTIAEVWVNVLDETGTWTFARMVESVPGTWTVSVDIEGTHAQFGVQAVDACGNVGVTFDKGEFFDVVAPGSEPVAFAVEVDGVAAGAGSTDWFQTAEVSVFGPSGAVFTVTIDGGEPFEYSAPFAVPSVEGAHTVVVTSSSGETQTIEVLIDNKAPTVVFVNPAEGASYEVGEAVLAEYQCVDGGSGVATCEGDAAQGQALDTATMGDHTVTVTTSDLVGHGATSSATYRVVHRFDGFYAPIRNETNTFNRVKAGSTVPMQWRVYSDTGEVTYLSVVEVLQSHRIECLPGMILIDLPVLSLGTEGLRYTDRFHYNWKTRADWVSQCRTFEVILSDGAKHTAQFKFF